MKQKLTPQIIGAYMPEFLFYKNDSIPLCAINITDESVASCKLILTPLSQISEEHASMCASQIGLHTEGNVVGWYNNSVIITNDTYKLEIGYNGFIGFTKNGTLLKCNINCVLDKLRELGYDCGYGKIDSLIEAGIAVKAQKND